MFTEEELQIYFLLFTSMVSVIALILVAMGETFWGIGLQILTAFLLFLSYLYKARKKIAHIFIKTEEQ